MNLTSKQKHFADLVASGCPYAQAFRESYDCSGSKPSTIRTDASRLARHPKIRAYLKELERAKRIAQLLPRQAKTLELLSRFDAAQSERDKLGLANRLIRLVG